MLINYTKEIINRIVLSIIVWLSIFLVSYLYKETLLYIIIKPSFFFFNFNSLYFISTELTEILTTYVKLSIFLSNQVGMTYGFYQVIIFISPGLYNFEYKNLLIIIKFYIVLWVLITIILYYKLLPWSWEFFLSFQQTTLSNKNLQVYFEAKLSNYLTFFIDIYTICLINCQFVCVLFTYFYFIKKKLKFLKNYRKIVYFFSFIIASIITPPDVISQLILGILTIVIFEFVVILILIFNKVTN